MKFRLWTFGGKFDDIHFIQLFLAGHCHISGGYARLIAGNKVLKLADLLLLAFISGF